MDETVVSLAATAVGESMDSRSMPDAPPSVLEILSVATYACDAGGRIIDSPGVRDFAPAIDDLERTTLGFREVADLAAQCAAIASRDAP